jgi:TRAP-type transport system small permease protein
VLGGLIIAYEFWKLLSGQLTDDQLIGIVESEDDAVSAEAAALEKAGRA